MKRVKEFFCEVLTWFIIDGLREQRWVLREVAQISDGSKVRCRSCHHPVKIHRQRILNGPRDHVEHFELNPNCNLSRELSKETNGAKI